MTATVARPVAGTAAVPFRSPHHPVAGWGTMIRFTVRRNRVRLAVWFTVVVGLFAYVGAYYQSVFTTQASLDDFAKLGATASMKALTGVAAVPNTLGGAVWTKIWMTCALSIAFGVIFLVTRNTRTEEETGRAELLRSRVLGLWASSVATYLVVGALCLAVGVGVAGAGAAQGLDPDGAGISGSLVMGASVFGVAWVALGVGALSSQLTSTGRGANALGSAVFGVFYVLRMLGDLEDSALTWVSPIGWAEKMAPYGPDRWWPLLPLVALGGVMMTAALGIEAHRDHASGVLAQRPGPAQGAASLGRPWGLAFRLQRGPVIGWSVTILLTGLMFGSMITSMTDLIADAGDTVASFIGGRGADALASVLVMVLGMLAAVFALQTSTQLRLEEANGTIETQLAGAISRRRWVVSRLLLPVLGTPLLLITSGTLMGLSYAASGGESSIATLIGAALAYWPAAMVLVGIAVALFGWWPRAAVSLTWGLLAAVWFIALIGEALNLPQWFLDATPFAATPRIPMESMNWAPLIIMTAVSIVLFVAGLIGFERRDIKPE